MSLSTPVHPFMSRDKEIFHKALTEGFGWWSLSQAVARKYQGDIIMLFAAGLPVTINGMADLIERAGLAWLREGHRGMGVGRAKGMRSAIHKLYTINGVRQPEEENDRLNCHIEALQAIVNQKIVQFQLDPKTDYGAMTEDLFVEYFLVRARRMADAKATEREKKLAHRWIKCYELCFALGLRINEIQYVQPRNFRWGQRTDPATRESQQVMFYTSLAHKNTMAKEMKTTERLVHPEFAQQIESWLEERRQKRKKDVPLVDGWDMGAACKFFSEVTDAMLQAGELAGFEVLKWTTHCLRNGAAVTAFDAAVGDDAAKFRAVGLATGHASLTMQKLYARSNDRRVQDRTARQTAKKQTRKEQKRLVGEDDDDFVENLEDASEAAAISLRQAHENLDDEAVHGFDSELGDDIEEMSSESDDEKANEAGSEAADNGAESGEAETDGDDAAEEHEGKKTSAEKKKALKLLDKDTKLGELGGMSERELDALMEEGDGRVRPLVTFKTMLKRIVKWQRLHAARRTATVAAAAAETSNEAVDISEVIPTGGERYAVTITSSLVMVVKIIETVRAALAAPMNSRRSREEQPMMAASRMFVQSGMLPKPPSQ